MVYIRCLLSVLVLFLSSIRGLQQYGHPIHLNRLRLRSAAAATELPVTLHTSSSSSSLYGGMNNTEFAAAIKTMASRRTTLTTAQKTELARHFFAVLPSLEKEQRCDCIWAMGTLSITSFESPGSSSGESASSLLLSVLDEHIEDRKQLLKVYSGLCKLGIQWSQVSEGHRAHFANIFMSMKAVESDPKETSILLYTLGHMGFRKENANEDQLNALLFSASESIFDMNVQGLANMLTGMAKIGFTWRELSEQLMQAISSHSAALLPRAHDEELTYLLNSLALLKAQWKELGEDFISAASSGLIRAAGTFKIREVSNALWFLGKLNASPGRDLLETLLSVLTKEAHQVQPFDLESLFVGLGLMEISFKSLESDLRRTLLKSLDLHLDTLNIYGVSNALWGLARMGAHRSDFSPALSRHLLERTVFILHTFLPTQLGDVLWSLGSLGYYWQEIDVAAQDRVLAVVSRVFGKLHVRAAAYALWGLGKVKLG